MANRTAAFWAGYVLALNTQEKSYKESLIFYFFLTSSVFVRWNKLLLGKGTVVLHKSYNATFHFNLTACDLTKMDEIHATMTYLLQNSLTAK